MTEKIKVSNFGIHIHGGMPFLHQSLNGKVEDPLDLGISSPFKVIRSEGLSNQPHQFSFSGIPELEVAFNKVFPKGIDHKNPLIKFFFPVPDIKESVAHIPQSFNPEETLVKLSALQNPVMSNIYWDGDKIQRLSNLSNIVTLIYKPQAITSQNWAMISSIIERFRFGVTRLMFLSPPYTPLPHYVDDYSQHFNNAKVFVKNHSIAELRAAGNYILYKWIENHVTSN